MLPYVDFLRRGEAHHFLPSFMCHSYVCAGQPDALGPFEQALFVPIQAMLANDVVGESYLRFR